MTRLTDICSSTLYKASDGYLSSPSFPEMYPPEKNCTCSLRAPPNQHVQIDSAFFLLKSSRPCRDWLRITADNDETTKCGYVPEQKRFLGQEVTINFKSDAHDTEMGFWLRFSGTRHPLYKFFTLWHILLRCSGNYRGTHNICLLSVVIKYVCCQLISGDLVYVRLFIT